MLNYDSFEDEVTSTTLFHRGSTRIYANKPMMPRVRFLGSEQQRFRSDCDFCMFIYFELNIVGDFL